MTSAAEHLFTVPTDAHMKILDKEQAMSFNHDVVQMIFAMNQTKKEIKTAVEFITTRLRSTDEDDWRSLWQLLQYIKSTIHMPMILRVDKLNIIKWWEDNLCAINNYLQSHTGATMHLGWVLVDSISKRKNLNRGRAHRGRGRTDKPEI